ncbi:ATP-binding cassette domain-containing protein [Anaerosporobacter sp.]|uniref:ATP-binding cassette domain-containing protein n=1 Tax=Anaerosporobacter sp. TaxID=1872529 RepID=UPI00286EB5FF|nr:ATP-binding cassette domain-containing protein [Anaerosporobacter sp.]
MQITVKNICKTYDNQTVLKDLSCSFSSGTIHCIMGESGKGKTTLLRILMGLERADSGELVGLEGKKIRAVFQENRLLEENTIMDNILFVMPDSNDKLYDEIRNACEMVGLSGNENKPVKELSGGMKRRVAILRAFLSEFDIVLLDEPLKGLDFENKQRVVQFMKSVMKQRDKEQIIIMVTHDKEDVELIEGSVCLL